MPGEKIKETSSVGVKARCAPWEQCTLPPSDLSDLDMKLELMLLEYHIKSLEVCMCSGRESFIQNGLSSFEIFPLSRLDCRVSLLIETLEFPIKWQDFIQN